MLSSLVRAVEPYFKVLSRSASPWKGHHIVHSDLQRAAIPWGFVSQQKVLESVTPDRTGGKVETSAGELNLDTWEFLRGTEEAYRCAARLFAPLPPPTPPLPLTPPLTASTSASTCSRRHHEGGDTSHKRDRISNGSNISDRGDRSRRGGMGRSGAIDESGGIDRSSGVGRSGGTDDSDRSDRINNTSGGIDGSGGIDVERYRQHLAGVSRGSASAADTVGRSATTRGKPDRAGIPTAVAPPPTDFLDFDIASPQMSMFLNDVLESYQTQGLVPRLSVSTVTARLCNVGVRLGGISKNTNFLGLASADELKYHLTMGMLGPEGAVINELEGRAPQRVIAEVELTCEEEFVLENEAGEVLHRPEARGPKVHFVTFQSNIGEGTTLEWQITNINDVIKPTFAYYFSRFGH